MPTGRRDFLGSFATTLAATGIVAVAGCTDRSDSRIVTETFVNYAQPGHHDAGSPTATATATPRRYRLLEDQAHWQSLPVPFTIGTAGGPDAVTADDLTAAARGALRAWNGISGAPAVFDTPSVDGDLGSATHGNGENEVVWSSLPDDTVGRATLRWDAETGRLHEVDVELNASLPWTTSPGDDPEAYDLQSVLAHELGHNGLGDLHDATSQTMYHVTRPGRTRKRTPESGDATGWRQVYGSGG